MSKSRIAFLACAITLTTTSVLLAAALTSITYSPDPIVVGHLVTYTAHDDGLHPIDSYKWEFICKDAGCSGATWQLGNTSKKTWTVYESRVGQATVRCTAKYKRISPQTPSDSTKSIDVTMGGPNSETLDPTCLGVDMPINNTDPSARLICKFEWKSGDTKLGHSIEGYVQEWITHIDPSTGLPYIVTDPNYKDGPWEGPYQGTYYYQAGYTIDGKAVGIAPAEEANLPFGTIYREFEQTNRIVIKNCCGTYQTFDGQKRRFRMVKSGPGTWQLIQR